jgi:hypothetical protein
MTAIRLRINGAEVGDDVPPRLSLADYLRDAVTADLDRAAYRHFDEFQRNLHTVAAMRAVQQVLQ